MKKTLLLSLVLSLVSFCSAGTIIGWGYNQWDQVSNIPSGDDFVAVGAGAYYGIALRADGSLVCWGNDDTGIIRNTPSGNDFIGIVKNGASAYANAYAIKSDGSLVGWGYSSFVPEGTGFKKVDCMSTYGLALKDDGSIVVWDSVAGSLVEGAFVGNDFIDIAGDAYHGLALREDGTIATWGDNRWGQSNIPMGDDYIDIACAYGSTSLALRSNGEVVIWGDILAPPNEFEEHNDLIKLFSSYQYNAIGLRLDGSMVVWGSPEGGMLANAPTGIGFIDIASGEYFGLALIPEPCTLLLLGLGGLLIRKR